MATAPTLAQVKEYVGADIRASDTEISDTLATELLAQARVCKIPTGTDPYPADLKTALYRRVMRALAIKTKPLGYELGIDGGVAFVGSRDHEIRRLETPYRKRATR